jgi:acetyltransferase-like isoleucine patch superfamily enzyme
MTGVPDFFCELREIVSYKIGSTLAVYLFRITDGTSWIDWSVRYRMPSKICVGSNCEIRRGVLLDGRSPFSPSIVIGNYCRIKENVSIMAYSGKVELGEHVLVGPGSRIFGHGGVSIGKYSMLGGGVSMISANYVCAVSRTPFQYQGYIHKPIKISSNVWIGDNSTILGGVTIEEDVVVGAGSVVPHDLKSGYVYAGNPAERVRALSNQKLDLRIHFRNWRAFSDETKPDLSA